jgi:DNA-binding MarR family transcriptional regulator
MASSARSLRAQCLRVSAECTASQLRRAARAISRIHDQTIASSGLRGTQFNVLVALSLFGEVPLLRLADRLGLERTTLTRNLRPLERDGLVTSSPGPDLRVRMLRLTEDGRRALERAMPLWEQAQRRVVRGLGEGRWRELLDGLNAASTLRVEG